MTDRERLDVDAELDRIFALIDTYWGLACNITVSHSMLGKRVALVALEDGNDNHR